MPQSAPTFSIEDLLIWIDQSVRDLQGFVGPQDQVVSSFAFEMMLCAAVATAIPGASMGMVEAGMSFEDAINLTPVQDGQRPMTLPVSHQRFVIQFRDILINGSGVIDRSSLDEMVRQAYRDDLELHAPSLMDRPIQVKYQDFKSDDLSAFASGAWTQFVIGALEARHRANLAAGALELSTGQATAQDNKSSPRRM